MNEIYCPYTDRMISESSASLEHVMPLSLGGSDDFTILVDRDANSQLGSAVDGALSNDPIVAMMRAKKGATGQSGKPFAAKWKKTKGPGDRPLQAVIGENSFELFDPVQRRILEDNETRGWELKTSLRMDPYIRIPFAAKVALGTGYFLFGDLFREHCSHDQLRDCLEPVREADEALLKGNKIRYLDRLLDRNNDRAQGDHQIFEQIISYYNCSAVILRIGANSLCFSIGLFGEWQSTITVPANGHFFPVDDEFDQGYSVLMDEGKLRLISFRRAAYEMATQHLGIELPPFDVLLATAGFVPEQVSDPDTK